MLCVISRRPHPSEKQVTGRYSPPSAENLVLPSVLPLDHLLPFQKLKSSSFIDCESATSLAKPAHIKSRIAAAMSRPSLLQIGDLG